ncbi:MAG: type II secretion system F family protein [Limisphaerales bacterium]
MDLDEFIIRILVALFLTALWFAVCFGLVALAHFFLTLPMRRAERARLFLDLISDGLQQGRTAEQTILSVAASHDLSVGVRFHILAAWIEQNVPLLDALAKVPRFLPPQIIAMLHAGRKTGDLAKILPACRQLLRDAVSQTRSAMNYLVVMTFVVTPASIWVIWALNIFVFPKFREIAFVNGVTESNSASISNVLMDNGLKLLLLQLLVLALIWCGAFIYAGGPRLASWFPILHSVYFRLPWRRRRMQRDFSTMLAVLLDSGIPEADAVVIAADCTANRVFQRRATSVADALKRGVALPEAIQAMDDSGEFGWRLRNAMHQRGGFCEALAGWNAWLDVKAFQQEQAAAHTITSGLVLWNGAVVGAIVFAVFGVLISIVNAGVLW